MNFCPSPIELQQFLEEKLPPDAHTTVDAHVAECAECQRRLGELAKDRTIDDLVRPAAAVEAEQSAIRFPGPPTEVGPLGTFESFHVKDVLGEGTFGFVFRAWDAAMGREVAVKVLKPQFAAVQSHRDRFDREAKAVAAIHHPNVVTIHQVGRLSGSDLPYTVMELLAGETLEQRLRRDGVVAPMDAAQVLKQVANGLEAVHAAHISGSDPLNGGLVHRDVKPSNIMLETGPHGQLIARIADFGLARPITGERNPVSGSGQILGTLPYMSPEQIESPSKVDGRADVYSLGAVGFEMLAGKRLYDAATPGDIIRLIYEAATDGPRRYNELVPLDLETIILTCLAKDPARRFQATRELADDLDRYLTGQPIHARRVSHLERLCLWARRKPVVAGLSAVIILLLVGSLGTFFGLWRRADSLRVRAEIGETEATGNLARAVTAEDEAKRNLQLALDAVNRNFRNTIDNEYLRRPGLQPLKRQLLETILEFDRKFVEQQPDDPSLQEALGDTWLRLAANAREIASKEEALQLCERAVHVFEKLDREHPGNARYRHGLAQTRAHMAVLANEAGDRSRAARIFPEALALFEECARDQPSDVVILDDLADTLNNYSIYQGQIGKTSEAAKTLLRCIELREQVVLAAPNNLHHRRVMSSSYSNLAAKYTLMDKIEDARAAYLNAINIQRSLVEAEPHDSQNRSELVMTLSNFGWFSIQRRLIADAEKTLQEAQALCEQLVQENPVVPDYKDKLAHIHAHRGELFELTSRFDDAETAQRKAIEILDRLAANHAANESYQNQLGRAFRSLAKVLAATRRWTEAEVELKRSREVYQQLVRDHGDVFAYRDHLGETLGAMARLYRVTGRLEEAATEYAAAADLYQELAEQDPTVPNYRIGLLVSLGNLGIVRYDQHRLDEAEKHQLRALEILKRLVAEDPTSPEHRSNLVSGYNSLGNLFDEQKRNQEAERAYQEAVAVGEKLVDDFPTVSGFVHGLASSLNNLVRVIKRDRHRAQEAEALHKKALGFLEQLVERDKRDPEAAMSLANVLNSLGVEYLDGGRVADAQSALERAVELTEALVTEQPNAPEFGRIFAAICRNMGRLHDSAGQYDQAVDSLSKSIRVLKRLRQSGDLKSETARLLCGAYVQLAQVQTRKGMLNEGDGSWQRAIELVEPRDTRTLKIGRAHSWAESGQHIRAAQETEELLADQPVAPISLYSAACVLAVCASTVYKDESITEADRQNLSEKYAARAIGLLRRVKETRFFRDPENQTLLETDKDLDALRDRADFQAFLAQASSCL